MSDIGDLIYMLGEDKAYEILSRYIDHERHDKNNILTIVVNKGVHHLPVRILRGTVFIASEGNLDFSSAETVHGEFERILKLTSKKLKSKNWKQIYIVPYGPCALSMQIKLLVYRITRIESIDVFHLGEGEYIDLELSQRHIIVETE